MVVIVLKVLAAALGVPLVFVGAGWFAWRVMRHRTVWQGIRLAAILMITLALLVLLGVPQRVFGQVTAVPVTIVVRAIDDDAPLRGVVVRLAGIPTGSVPTDDQGVAVLAAPPGRLILRVTGTTAEGSALHFPALYDALGGLPVFVQATPTTITLIADRDGTLHPVALDPNAVNGSTGSQDAPTAVALPTRVPATTVPTDTPMLPSTVTMTPPRPTIVPPSTPSPALPTVALPTAAPFAPPAGAAAPPPAASAAFPLRQVARCGGVILLSLGLVLWVKRGGRAPLGGRR